MQRPIVFALALLFAGCVAGPTQAPTPAPVPVATPALVQEHDHQDPSLHSEADGLRLMGYHSLAPEGERGEWMNSEIIVRGSMAYVGYLGAPWLMAVVDLADPRAPALVGTLDMTNAWAMDMAVDDAGEFAYVSVYPGAIGTVFAPDYLLKNPALPSGLAGPGVAVVDVRDPANMQVTGFLPVHGFGPHTAVYHKYDDGREVVFANKADVQGGNGIVAAEVVALPTGGKTLRPLSFFTLDGATDADFPHDVDVQMHPIDGRTLLYGAWWDQGLVILDVSDPAKPALVSRTADVPAGEEVQFHDAHAYTSLVDGKHYTITTPEIPSGETSGHLRVWDTSDPAAPVAVGEWIMPGDHVVTEPFSFSTHNWVFLPDGRIALAHGHAGVWIVDWLSSRGSAPVATAFYAAAAPDIHVPSWAPVIGAPWFWGTAIDERGLLWALDSNGGLVGLEEASAHS